MQKKFTRVAGHLKEVLRRHSQIIAGIRNALEIPAGYQDETGFHFGTKLIPIEVLRSENMRRTKNR
jgi:hypothetical protein